jgi:hypothetical protein
LHLKIKRKYILFFFNVCLFTSFPCNYGNYHSYDVAHTEDKNTGTTLEKHSIKEEFIERDRR